MPINTTALAKEGFTLIRNLLQQRYRRHINDADTKALALDIAEALHNLPEPGNTFQEALTIDRVAELTNNHEICKPLAEFA